MKQFWGLEFWLVYRDECGAYMCTHSTCTWTLFNQNKEMKRKISDSKTSCADETGHLRAPPTHLNTPDHWEAPVELG